MSINKSSTEQATGKINNTSLNTKSNRNIKSKAEHKNKRVARRESAMNAVRSTMIYMSYRNNFQRNTM
jgi:hypothetical protein